MAKIIGGVGTSHGPLLILPPEDWTVRADFDRKLKEHHFRGGVYDFPGLVAKRNSEQEFFEKEIRLEVRQERFKRCQVALDKLADVFEKAKPDVLVLVGDDQHEWFFNDLQPSYTIFAGDKILNSAYDPAKHQDQHPSIQMVQSQRHTPVDTWYDCVPDLAHTIIAHAMDAEFDVTASEAVPEGPEGPRGIGHAVSFIYRRILRDRPIPLVPILINTFFPPNQPTPKRCFELGQVIGRAIKSWDGDRKVMVVASGGLTHFVIDEAWDRKMIKAMQTRDYQTLTSEPNIIFNSGTSETKNWIVALGALSQTDYDMNLIDYVPCYRSEAGTGNAMAFATWQ
jgi:OH-DDVA oxygenase/3-O-methylgallate 3,4-dioxygenase